MSDFVPPEKTLFSGNGKKCFVLRYPSSVPISSLQGLQLSLPESPSLKLARPIDDLVIGDSRFTLELAADASPHSLYDPASKGLVPVLGVLSLHSALRVSRREATAVERAEDAGLVAGTAVPQPAIIKAKLGSMAPVDGESSGIEGKKRRKGEGDTKGKSRKSK